MRIRLRNALFGDGATEDSVMQIIEYLGLRLSAKSPSERALAVNCFSALLEVSFEICAGFSKRLQVIAWIIYIT